MSEDEMNADVAGERPAKQEVCVVLRWTQDDGATVWGVFRGSDDTSPEEAAKRELGIRVRGAWPNSWGYASDGALYVLRLATVQP